MLARHDMAGRNESRLDGEMKQVTKKKANKQKIKAPPMSEERIRELNEIMFTYNPYKNRRDPRLKGNPFPPWAYTAESIADKGSVEYMFHPDIYKTNTCNRGANCTMDACAFIHPGETYVPRWRATGAVFDGVFYPPLPITYEWFKFMMREFKTTGPCKATYNHDHARCHYYHVDPKDPSNYYDIRQAVEIDVLTEQWKPLAKNASPTARQFHPTTYKLDECRRIAQNQKCTKGRYCSFNHLNHESQKVQEHLHRLAQEILKAHKVQQDKAAALAKMTKAASAVPGLLPPAKPAQPPRPSQPAPTTASNTSLPGPGPIQPPAESPLPTDLLAPSPPGVEDGAVDEMTAKLERIRLLQQQYEELKRLKEQKASQVSPSPIQPPAPSPLPLASPSPTLHTPSLSSMHDAFWGPPQAPQQPSFMPYFPAGQPPPPPGMPMGLGMSIGFPTMPPQPQTQPLPQSFNGRLPGVGTRPVSQWSKDDVYAWAIRQGASEPLIAELAAQLYDNDIDGSLLLALHEGDLNDLGITSLGKKKKLMAAVNTLRQPTPSPPSLADHFTLF